MTPLLLLLTMMGTDLSIGVKSSVTYKASKQDKLPIRGVTVKETEGETAIKPGDVITDIDNKTKINTPADLKNWLKDANPSKTYKVNLYRNDGGKWAKRTVSVKPVEVAAEEKPGEKKEDQPEKKLSARYVRIEPGMFRVQAVSPIVYLPSKGEKVTYRFLSHSFKEVGSKTVQNDKGGFYSVKGEAKEFRFESDTPELLTIGKSDKLGLQCIFKDAGEPIIDAVFDDKVIAKLTLKVVRLEINEKDADSTVVKRFGLPDREKKHYIKWPETKIHDEIVYSPTAAESIIEAKHWQWDKFPHLTVSIVDSKVHRLGSDRWQDSKESLDEITAWKQLVLPQSSE